MATVTPARIDEEINAHLLSLSNLRSLKNSFLPIFHLPPETLADIFTRGARDYHENNSFPVFCIPDWVSVSYVCRHWRNVALDCPTLWAYHFTVSLRWTEELLARSKQASLKIRICHDSIRPRSWWLALLEKLFSHAERVQELRLKVPATVLPSKLTLCGSRLRTLDICTLEPSMPFDWTTVLNSGNILSLRTLRLVGCPLPWHSLNLSGLTSLFLRFIPDRSRQGIVEFLPTLSRMPGLEVLYLNHALASARGFISGGAFDVSTKVGLPCLARLVVIAPLSTVVALLSCTDIPLKAKLSLEFQSDGGFSVADYARISSILARRFIPSEDLPSSSWAIRSLGISYPLSSFTFTLCASEKDRCSPCVSMETSDAPLIVVVGMQDLVGTTNVARIISDICCSIPSIHVQSLHVTYPPSSHGFWKGILGHLHGLQHLKLCDNFMPDLISFLTVATDESAETPRETDDRALTPGHTYIPALEELELYRIMFASSHIPLSDFVSEKSLLDALSTRKTPHPRLTMIECDHTEDEYSDVELDDEEDIYPFGDYISSSDEYY